MKATIVTQMQADEFRRQEEVVREENQRHHDHYVRLKKEGSLKAEDEPQYTLAMSRESQGLVKAVDD